MSKLNIAVVGAGYWGKNLVRNFSEIGVLHTICDSNQEFLEKFKKEYNVKGVLEDYEKVLKNRHIHAVVLATPAATHYDMVKKALLANKDVFVEKPLALEVSEAKELADLAEKKNRILMVDHILHYHPAIIKLKNLIDHGELGKLQYIYSNRLNIGRLRQEENILWSFAPHDISVILHLTHEQPIEVNAFGGAFLRDNNYDTTITHLTFSDRLIAHTFVSWLHPFKVQKLVVVGDQNMAVFDDIEKENKLILYPHKVEWIQRMPIASKAKGEVVEIEQKEPLKEACLHFLQCVQTRETPCTDAQEALSVLSVLEQAQNSLDKRNETK